MDDAEGRNDNWWARGPQRKGAQGGSHSAGIRRGIHGNAGYRTGRGRGGCIPGGVSLVREHRQDIAGQRSLAETLKGLLEEAIGSREPIERAIEEETAVAPDTPGYVKAQADSKRKALLRSE